jgi:hypothetical protein
MASLALSPAIIAGNIEALRAIRDEDVSLAIWERAVPAELAEFPLLTIIDLRFSASLKLLPARLQQAMVKAGYGRGVAQAALHDDILLLAKRFAAIMRCDAVEIRLEHVTTNACKKFHGDYVTARLICTYVGPGTEWLEGEDDGGCDCGDPHNIRRMNAGDVGMFKGRLWSEHAPAIHRSPPIEGTGEERLVLVINPATADSI